VRVVFIAAALLLGLPAVASDAAPPGKAQLSITVWPQGRGVGNPVRSYTLRCRPAGGSLPAPARACRRLFANLGALRPVPAGRVCAPVNGGPQQAIVRGTVAGKRVRASFRRVNACELARWTRLAPLFGRDASPIGLQITVWPDGRRGRFFSSTLTCNPAGGTHPAPGRACMLLAALDAPFAPVPSGRVCLPVSAGPQVGLVRGTFRGGFVDARFVRSDSCETVRWDRVAILFAEP
jgi:hypothetical protein